MELKLLTLVFISATCLVAHTSGYLYYGGVVFNMCDLFNIYFCKGTESKYQVILIGSKNSHWTKRVGVSLADQLFIFSKFSYTHFISFDLIMCNLDTYENKCFPKRWSCGSFKLERINLREKRTWRDRNDYPFVCKFVKGSVSISLWGEHSSCECST